MAHQIDNLNMVQRARLLWGLLRDERVSPWLKRIGPAAIFAYVLSPIDIIPDFLIGPGQVDDLGVIAIGMVLMLRLIVRFAPAQVVNEHLRRVMGVPPAGDGAGAQGTGGENFDDYIETTGRMSQP